MTNEDSVLEEAIANLREATQRIHATQNVMHARGMTEDVSYRELMTRLSTALAMTEAAYVEAKRRRGFWARLFWDARRVRGRLFRSVSRVQLPCDPEPHLREGIGVDRRGGPGGGRDFEEVGGGRGGAGQEEEFKVMDRLDNRLDRFDARMDRIEQRIERLEQRR